jgi:glutathione S-transferase
MSLPILYSFRRCPYAMRARCALLYAKIPYEHREIELRQKPKSMLRISPKGTVPVLCTQQQDVIDESLDVMYWALAQHDPDKWLPVRGSLQWQQMEYWIGINDGPFKVLLDIYKYPERHPSYDREEVFQQAMELYLFPLNAILEKQAFLLGEHVSMLDIALMPFVRQFVGVDSKKVHETPINKLLEWLNFFILSDLFHTAMAKYPLWRDIND